MSLSFGKYCIKTPKIPLFFGGIIIILGLLATLFISKESAPYIEYGIVTINTPYSGVGAEDIDSTITQKIESTVKNVDGIDSMESRSTDGLSNIVLTLETDAVVSDVVSDLRSAVDTAKADLPSDLDADPRIAELDSSGDRPFLSVALLSEKNRYSPAQLSEIAEKLEKKLENISGVASVTVRNKVETEVKILLDKNKMSALGLSYAQIVSALQASEKNTPLGTLSLQNKDYTLRFQGESKSLEALGNSIVGKVGDGLSAKAVRLNEIADIKMEAIKNAPITHFYSERVGSSENAIVLGVARSGGGDIFSTEKKVLAEIDAFLENPEYKNISSDVFTKATRQMTKDYWNLLSSFCVSIAIVLLSIFLFIGVKEGVVASFVIPLSFLGTVFVLYMTGRTMNFMTNFGMILALGILVDTAIVMVEGTAYYIKKGLKPQEAALQSFIEFRAPLFAGMLTTLIVFLPLFFLPGVVGKFLSFIPITVTIVLIVALLVSLFIIPALSGVMLQSENDESREKTELRSEKMRKKIDSVIDIIIEKYVSVLGTILRKRLLKYGIFLGTLFAFFATFFIPSQFEMFPTSDSDTMSVILSLENGTDETVVENRVQSLEAFIKNLPEVEVVQSSIVGNTANLSLELFPIKEREARNQKTSKELEVYIQENFSNITESEKETFQVKRQMKGPPSEFPVGFRVKIENISQLQEGKNVALRLTQMLKETEGTQGVTNSITEIPGEYRFILDREKAFLKGVNPANIPFAIRGANYGTVIETFTKGETDYDIRLQVDPKSIQSVDDVLRLEVQKGVYLSDVVTVEKKSALSEVVRNEGDLAFTVSAFLTEDGNAERVSQQVQAEIEKKQKSGEFLLPDGIRIEDASENAENAELIQSLAIALVMALLFMFFILVIQFEAFAPPLLILQTVVFAQIGVAIGLYITGTDKSLSYMLGVISLSGIVVNDAIILVDKIRSNIFSGKFQTQLLAVLDAGKTRFIPVVLTTLTTSAGIIPLIFIDSFWAALAYTIIFGLSVSSLLTLFLIPIGYLLFEKQKS